MQKLNKITKIIKEWWSGIIFDDLYRELARWASCAVAIILALTTVITIAKGASRLWKKK